MIEAQQNFETTSAAQIPDAIAPDGSEIRFLLNLPGVSTVHCSLPPGGVSRAVEHSTVQEIWHFLGGVGEVWRSGAGQEEVVQVTAGVCLSIPLGTRFQFRNTGHEALQFFVLTMPPWPGEEEARRVADYWPVA